MLKIEYDSKKDLMQVNDWQKESNMQEVLTLLMILWDETILCGKGTITDEMLFKEMKELSKLRLGGKEEKEVFKEHFTKPSYTDLEKEIERLNKERETDIKYNKYLQKEIAKANSIIKEVREYIEEHKEKGYRTPMSDEYEFWDELNDGEIKELLEIIDKENK